MSLSDDIAGISATTKSIAVAAFGAAIALGGRLAGGSVAVLVIGGGLIAMGLVLLAVAQTLQFAERRRSSSFGKGLQRDVSDKFRQGWQRLAKAGKDKDPYFLPWYIMVGEPGAGKTQAIKHSQIKFVPGFNDPATGEGGTLAMDWWFADKAILLDTAGALLMDTARTEDFQEFLRRIRQHRPVLPINGLILAIPANALQTDSISEIQAKATVIAQQLDLVQRELGVRFPVYVIITKADLISGFREYFDNITDPTMPTQILGWSNPSGLDGAFDPAEVEAHLESVAAALRRRRLRLLLDPIGDENAVSRIDKTDALYAFPEQMAQAGLRLRTYLENVFLPSEWTQAPLFLRGFYFTSSMREGPPLDLDLAQSFNISPKDLPAEVRVWEREKSCFLRDLFVEKIFRERGLVTASKQVEKRVRKNRNTVLGVGITALVAVLAFTVFGYVQLKQSIGGEYDFWTAVTRSDAAHPVAASALDWVGQPPDASLDQLAIHYDDAVTLGDLYAANVDLAQKDIQTPLIFYFAQAFGGDINAEHVAAHRLLFDRSVSRAAWGWLLEQRPSGSNAAPVWPWADQDSPTQRAANPAPWNDADQAGANVLAELILMDLGGAPHEETKDAPPQELAAFKDLLDAAGWPDDASSVRTYRDAWLWFALHTTPAQARSARGSAKWAATCVDRLIAYYNSILSQALETRAAVLSAAVDDDAAELAFLQMARGAATPSEIQKAWSSPKFSAVLNAGAKLTDALRRLNELPGEAGAHETFAHMYESGSATTGMNAISRLINALKPCSAAADMITELQAAYGALQKSLSDSVAGPGGQIAQLSAWSANAIDDWHTWPYARRLHGYRLAATAWAAADGPVKPDALDQELASAASWLNAPDYASADLDGANAALHKALQTAAQYRANVAWTVALKADQALLTKVAAAGGGTPIALPTIPFATLAHPPSSLFDPATAKSLLDSMEKRQKLWAKSPVFPSDQTGLQQLMAANQALLRQYLASYAAAWEGAMAIKVGVQPDFKLPDIEGATDSLKQLGERVHDALSVLPSDPTITATLASIAAGESAPADLDDRGKRLLSDWKTVMAGAPKDQHWRDEMHFFDNSDTNFVSDYWKRIAECVAACSDIMDANPSLEVSTADPADPAAPPDVAAAAARLRGAFSYILIGNAPGPVAIASNTPQSMKLQDGLDVRLLDANNTPQDTAGGASQWEVIKLLTDPRSVRSADPAVWYVYMETNPGKYPLWLKLHFTGAPPKWPG